MTNDHLSKTARNDIRYHIRATEQGVAAKYGISVAMVREIRANAQPNHPARLAAQERRGHVDVKVSNGGGSGAGGYTVSVTHTVIPAAQVSRPKGQLHTEGGVELPVPLT